MGSLNQEVLMLRRSIGVLAVLACVAVPAAAQTVDEILAKNIEAKGGLAKLKAVQSMRMTGKMTLGPGIEAPIVLETKRPKLLRIDITVQGMTIVQAFDGTSGWMLNPLSGRADPEQMPSEVVKLVEEQADMDGPFIDYKAKGSTVELLGKEQAEGTTCYKVKLTLKGGDTRIFYIDTDSNLEVRVESKTTIRGAEQESDTIVGDYKKVGDLMIPHAIDSGQKGAPMRQKMTIDKVEVGVPIDDARFKMPVKK
jgi:hypothetical protein